MMHEIEEAVAEFIKEQRRKHPKAWAHRTDAQMRAGVLGFAAWVFFSVGAALLAVVLGRVIGVRGVVVLMLPAMLLGVVIAVQGVQHIVIIQWYGFKLWRLRRELAQHEIEREQRRATERAEVDRLMALAVEERARYEIEREQRTAEIDKLKALAVEARAKAVEARRKADELRDALPKDDETS